MTYFDVHDTKQHMISKIRRLINYHHHTKVYTDEYLAYENLKKYGFVHKQVCPSQKEYTTNPQIVLLKSAAAINNVEYSFDPTSGLGVLQPFFQTELGEWIH